MPADISNPGSQAPADENNRPALSLQRLLGLVYFPLTMIQQFIGRTKSLEPSLSILTPSHAERLKRFSDSLPISDRKDELLKIMQDYARQPSKSLKDKRIIDQTMVKLFNKPTTNSVGDDTYVQCVNTSPRTVDVDPDRIYHRLLCADTVKPHPNGISSLAFAFAEILALSLHRNLPDQHPLTRNATSPYFDLSPLYGSSIDETNSLRMRDGSGMLWPDCFLEDRLSMVSDAVPALLILWNRYHNYVAKQLTIRNEKDTWQDPSKLEQERISAQDDEIFYLARRITLINFANIVKEDFLKGLLGLSFIGPGIEADILYDVEAMNGTKNGEYCSSIESYFLYDFLSLTPLSLVDKLQKLATDESLPADPDIQRRNYMGLRRNQLGYFEDDRLAAVLFDSTEVNAGAPGASSIPGWAREHVVKKIQYSRERNVCTLNQFRIHIGLQPLKSFEEWNPVVASVAKDLYDNIDNLELYPGLLAEEPMRGSGFHLGRTMTWGLMADIITRIRGDPALKHDFSDTELTKWGYGVCKPDRGSARGSFGAMFPKLLEHTLPRNYPYNNVYTLFPFITPNRIDETASASLEGEWRNKYDFQRPKERGIKVIRTIEAIRKVFNKPEMFPSPYAMNLADITGGYGHLLSFDDQNLHDRDLAMVLFPLLPDQGAAKRIGSTFAEKARELLVERSRESKGNRMVIDVIQDLINPTCVHWVCKTICDIPLDGEDIHHMTRGQKRKLADIRSTERGIYEDFAAYYDHTFNTAEPEAAWARREKVLEASTRLRGHLKMIFLQLSQGRNNAVGTRSIPRQALDVLTGYVIYWHRQFKQILRECSSHGERIPQSSGRNFLERMVKAAEVRPLKNLIDDVPHLKDLRDSLKDAKEPDVGQEIESRRMIANVIGLGMFASVYLPKVCAQAVDFYMDEKYSAERAKLTELCRDKDSSNQDIMGYIREAQRIGQRFGLWRNTVLPQGQTELIIQGHEYPDITVENGDRIFADFTNAHNLNKPGQFPDPGTVDLGRQVKSLLGLGLHKCPAGAFIDEAMAEIIRVIFTQGNLKRFDKDGKLKVETLRPVASPWDPEIFIDEDGGSSFYPKKLVLEFDAVAKPKEKWKFKESEDIEKLIGRIKQGLALIVVILMLLKLYNTGYVTSLFGPTSSSTGSGTTELNVECSDPTEIEPWHVKSFRPKWLGMFGGPAPIIYLTPSNQNAHRISFVDIDKRDIEINVWVDDGDRGHREVDINSSVDCGDDFGKCIQLGFSCALIDVPPGRHTVRAEIVDKNGTFKWGEERERRVMWHVEKCA